MYSMTPIFCWFFFAYEYKKHAKLHAVFKSVELIRKKRTQKKLFAKNFCKFVVKKKED